VSRRRDRRGGREAASAARGGETGVASGGESGVASGRDVARGAWAPGPVAPNRRPPAIPFLAQAGILIAVFAITTLIAELAGAANLGVSLGIATIPFSIALVLVIVRS
jgi:hypothetical protein